MEIHYTHIPEVVIVVPATVSYIIYLTSDCIVFLSLIVSSSLMLCFIYFIFFGSFFCCLAKDNVQLPWNTSFVMSGNFVNMTLTKCNGTKSPPVYISLHHQGSDCRR